MRPDSEPAATAVVGAPLSTGTSDRVLLLSGSLHSVLTAIFLILEKVARDNAAGKGKPSGGKDDGDREDEVSSTLSALALSALLGCTCGVGRRREDAAASVGRRLTRHVRWHARRRRSSWRSRGACAAC